jgi:hypothetical protein
MLSVDCTDNLSADILQIRSMTQPPTAPLADSAGINGT